MFGGRDVIERFDRYAMPEMKMTAEDILKNPVLIDSFNWTTANPRGTQLSSYLVPEIIGNKATFHQLMLQTYAYYKPTFVLRFVVNSTKFHVGRLLVSFDPFQQMLDAEDLTKRNKFANVYSLTGNPNVLMDAAYSNSAEIRIPFEHVQDYLTTNSPATFAVMGKIRVTVLNPLQVSTSMPTTVNIQTFLRAETVNLHVPVYPHIPQIPNASLSHFHHAESQGGALAKIGGPIGDTASGAYNAVWNVITGNFSGALSSGADALKGASALVDDFQNENFDKPIDGITATYNTIHPMAPLCHGKGVDSSIRLGITPIGAYAKHNTFSGLPSSEMNIAKLIKVKMLTNIFDWTQAGNPGDVLLSFPVMPSYTNYDTLAGGYSRVYSTFLSYLASSFCFWRGPISYRLDAVASQFHTGRLLICFTPNSNSVPPTLDQATQNPLYVWDLREDRSCSFTVPFQSSVPRKMWAPWASLTSRTQLTDLHVIGYVHVFILNQLRAPTNVATDIEVNLYSGAGDNFELDVPMARVTEQDFYAAGIPPALTSQGEDTVDQPSEHGHILQPEDLEPQPGPSGLAKPMPLPKSEAPLPPVGWIDTAASYATSLGTFAVDTYCNTCATQHSRWRLDDPIRGRIWQFCDLCERHYSPILSQPHQHLAIATSAESQSGSELPLRSEDQGAVQYLTKGAGKTAILNSFSERCMDVRDLARRFVLRRIDKLAWQASNVLIAPAFLAQQIYNITPNADSQVTDSETLVAQAGALSQTIFLTKMARMYALWHGSIRYKFQLMGPYSSRTSGAIMDATYIPNAAEFPLPSNPTSVDVAYGGYPRVTTNTAQQPTLQVEAPFYNTFNQCLVETTATAPAFALRNSSIRLSVRDLGTQVAPAPPIAPLNNPVVYAYIAGGDDIRFSYVVSPPVIYSSTNLL